MIPFSGPDLTAKESEYAAQAIASGWIGGKGDFIDKFEHEFAHYIGVRHAITCSSGTAGLMLAYLACGMKPESNVITPHRTFAATYNMASVISRNVRMVQPDPDTWNLHVQKCDTDIFVGVHLYGNPVDMGKLPSCDFTFIEDCAQSLGSEFKGKKTGSFGLASVFSFHSAKMLTTGEGGMVCTNDKDVATRVRHLKNQAMTIPYVHDQIGWNFRMTNVQAAIGLAQLERIDELVLRKQLISSLYEAGLSDKFIRQQNTRSSNVVKWANAYKCNDSHRLRETLSSLGIETRPGFNCEDTIVLPSGTSLTTSDINWVIEQANASAT